MADLNWLAVLAAVIAAQVVSTLWFVVLFGEPWAREFGVASSQEHAQQIPGFTYAVQLLCTVVLVVSLALLMEWLAIDSLAGALGLGLFVAIGFCVANGVPGQAFLKRWRVAAISMGCQSVMILVISLLLGAWR